MAVTDSDTQTGTWKSIPGFSAYEAAEDPIDSDGTQIQSLPGRRRKGGPLKSQLGNRGRYVVDLTDDEGRKRTCQVHVLVAMAHILGGPVPEGKKVRHLNDIPTDNRLVNLAIGTQGDNERDKYRNGHPKPVPPKRPPKPCVACGAPGPHRGQRCHPCVVETARQATKLLRQGMTPQAAAEQLAYPSAEKPNGEYLHTLAVKYGGWGQSWHRRLSLRLRER